MRRGFTKHWALLSMMGAVLTAGGLWRTGIRWDLREDRAASDPG
jgi:hypothetical protein